MSPTLDLLHQFETIGAKVESRDGRLVLRPGTRPIPRAMVAAAKLAKQEVLAAISGRQTLALNDADVVREIFVPIEVTVVAGRAVEPLFLRDGRRLWRFRAEAIPEVLNDSDIRPAVEARWFGCVLFADGHELVVVEPWLSNLPVETRAELAVNAGTIIALLRGESRLRTGR